MHRHIIKTWVVASVLYGSTCDVAHSSSIVPVEVRVPLAPTPVMSGGEMNLLYELHITNLRSHVLELTRVEIFDGKEHGELLNTYTDDELNEIVGRPGISTQERRFIAGGLRAVVFVQVIVEPGREPASLRHRLFFRSGSDDSNEEMLLELPDVAVRREAPESINPPLRGGPWLVANGLSNASDHRRALIALDGKARIAQRYATDWMMIGPDGMLIHDDPSANDSWYGYGAEVLAIADATVVAVVDGIPENVPFADERAVPITLSTIGGNHVVLELGRGLFAFYAHLQPNVIRVEVGDHVEQGQVLGFVGNSGNSDAPHLHLHIMDTSSPLGSEGLPYVFPSFDRLGTVDSVESLVMGEGWRTHDSKTTARKNELPQNNAVLSFP